MNAPPLVVITMRLSTFRLSNPRIAVETVEEYRLWLAE